MLCFTARSDVHKPEYTALDVQHLKAVCTVTEGDGTAEAPFLHQVTVRNEGDTAWNGVIKMDLPVDAASPRFFMPGYLYGTNRGDAPLQGESKVPRMRKDAQEFPASSWWMTRSDRMSHPAVFAFTGDRIVGLCAPPYYLKTDGRSPDRNLPGRLSGKHLVFPDAVGLRMHSGRSGGRLLGPVRNIPPAAHYEAADAS